jgi:hypothetical protein
MFRFSRNKKPSFRRSFSLPSRQHTPPFAHAKKRGFSFGSFRSLLDKLKRKPAKPHSRFGSTSQRSKTPDQAVKYKVFLPKNQPKLAKKSWWSFLKVLKFWRWHFGALKSMVTTNPFKRLRYLSLKFKLVERINYVVALTLFASLGLFVLYLSFFDTTFLIKQYNFVFASGSYVSRSDLELITKQFSTQKLAGILPYNQYWFLNEQNLTQAAQDMYPEITQIRILERQWPDTLKLEITTEPVLLTLAINSNQYWRISQSGRVLSLDDMNLRENVVTVDRSLYVGYSDLPGTTQVSFKDYTFEDKQKQKNRFWFIIWLWQQLKSYNLTTIQTILPSLSDYDSDVIVKTNQGTRLIFDVYGVDRPNQEARLKTFFDSELAVNEQKGQYAYVDFRTPKKFFVCPKASPCDK